MAETSLLAADGTADPMPLAEFNKHCLLNKLTFLFS